jgi:AraC-like DNA-binding protein
LLSVMRYCLEDPSAALLSVVFSGAPMGPASLYQEYYGCEVVFNQPNISMSVDSKYLLMPFESADPGLHGLLFEQALNKLPKESVERDFVGELHQATVRALHEGQPTANHIASKLHMSSRTLHRRLGGLGYIFRDFLKAIRKKMAKEYLVDEHLTLSEIALLLGYSEQSAFSRAFAEWFDMSPSEYKVSLVSTG